MRILQVNTADRGGGAEGSAWNLFRSYRSQGYRSWLAVGTKYSDDPDVLVIPKSLSHRSWIRFWLSLGNRLAQRNRLTLPLRQLSCRIAEPQRILDWWRGHDVGKFPGTWELLNLPPYRPDIVHCHNLHGSYFDLRALPWLSHQVPVILNLRDTWLFTGHCAHFGACMRWQIGCGKCPDLSIYPAIRRDATDYNWLCKKKIYAESKLYITTPSQWLMRQVQKSTLQGIQYQVIPNGVDLQIFCPGNMLKARQVLGLPEHAWIVLLIAHNMFKDYDTMETALRQLRFSSTNRLIFICLGKEGREKEIGNGRMIYRGFEHDPKRVAEYYHAANVYIHASKDEVFGKTITEAMACGLPVVATAVGGIPEQIENGLNGFLVPPQDSNAMAFAVARLLKDDALRSSIGQAAAIHAARHFSLDRQSRAFLNWYHKIREEWDHANPDAESIIS
ncbi:MAG: glycosyltransferase [candidate division KSB1 bacterium]|nr:glycosyltransferase [candidate division KSB1 bacterium]